MLSVIHDQVCKLTYTYFWTATLFSNFHKPPSPSPTDHGVRLYNWRLRSDGYIWLISFLLGPPVDLRTFNWF